MTAWLAHRLPAGDPLRERPPAALAAVPDRLAHPGLLLPTGKDVDLDRLREMTGPEVDGLEAGAAEGGPRGAGGDGARGRGPAFPGGALSVPAGQDLLSGRKGLISGFRLICR